MRYYVPAAIMLAAALVGCTPLHKTQSKTTFPRSTISPEYVKAWEAAKNIMEKNFMLRVADMQHGVIIAEPEVGANSLAKYRTRVEAQLVQTGPSLWDVEVRVMNEVEISEPNISGSQPRNYWATVAFDKILEVRLETEIKQERYGRSIWNLDSKYNKSGGGNAAPDKHGDLLKALPKSSAAPASSNPLSLARDATHLALIEKRPSFGDRYTKMIARGDLAFRRNDLDAAVIEYGTAAEETPNEPTAHVALSHAWFAQARYDESAHHLRKALALGTDWLKIKVDHAKLYGIPDAFGRQVSMLRQHVEKDPEDMAARFALGYILMRGGDREASITQIEAVLKNDPRDAAARKLLDILQQPA